MNGVFRRCALVAASIALLTSASVHRAKAAVPTDCEGKCIMALAGCLIIYPSPLCAPFYEGCIAGCNL